VIDLHLHTTASDGRSTPEALVDEAFAAGVRTLAVTDHDTMAAVAAVAAAAAARGMRFVPGIEITAVARGRDVHMLGYFLDAGTGELAAFLDAQRADRRRRVVEIVGKLRELGAPVAVTPDDIEGGAGGGRAIGRPFVAQALVSAGHARDIADAFDTFLGDGRPAFIPRRGASPVEVVGLIARAGGVSSLAHPGKLRLDPIIDELIDAGLTAIEAYHPDHRDADVERYVAHAASAGLLVTGGSDYHGPGSGRTSGLGQVGLPAPDFEALAARAGRRTHA